ncbi:PQQ-binding-like beta-propeller repeat protein [Microbacterium sp.]|uniref:PQQ-binding-like beta-propeller repeat protein n=1 Tax=Microbacterium sp. TaxID=51671 RepID=UPI0028121BE0|nr:PQQ-binding-like beta-propeller repeat protein [Microbacterium sp.]
MNRRRTSLAALCCLSALLCAFGTSTLGAAATASTAADPITDLGEPVHKVQPLASGIGSAPDGTPLSYFVVSGNENLNAEFTVVDMRTNEAVFQTRVPHGKETQRTFSQSPNDGTVYFGASDGGHLYRYVPGTAQLDYLGAVPRDERVWSSAVGPDDTVWFGTYPSGSLYSLDPKTYTLTDHGPALAGEQYIGSIAPHGDTVIVGTQPNGKLASYDRASGVFTEIEMPASHTGTAVSALDIRDSQLFVSSSNMYVRDLATGEWVKEITGANARVSPIDPNDADAVYLRQGTEIKKYSLSTGTLTGTGKRPNATPESWGWIDYDGTGPFLSLTYWNEGRTYGWNLQTGKGFYAVPPLMGAGAPLTSLGTDSAGDIYAGAFLSPPGMSRYNPDTGTFQLLSGTSQVEGYGTFGDRLVFGRYPQGSLYLYDPARPWSSTNPKPPLEIGDEQSRPQALVELESLPGTVAVASVPTGGRHGGAITLWQPDAGTHEVHRHVVRDQTPVSLIEHSGLLYGGTSVEGGYGIDPVTDEAMLFAWDPVTEELRWSLAPVPGAKTISGLAIGDDGRLWGIADGRTVFEFDLARGETVRTIPVDTSVPIDRYGDDHRLLFNHGRLFASLAHRLAVIDTQTGTVTTLYGRGSGRGDGVNNVHELAQDRHGDLYVVGSGTHLVRYDLPEDVTPPVVLARTGDAATTNGAAVWLEATDDADAEPRIDYRIDGGEWREYAGEKLLVKRHASLEYRAVDDAWNTSPVERYVR